MLSTSSPQPGGGESPGGSSIAHAFFALSVVSIVAYVLASEALRNFVFITIPGLVEKVGRS